MSKRKEQWENEQKLHRLFSECHEIGSRNHGYAWMRMNELMITAAVHCKVDYVKQPFKTMLTLCALKALNQMNPPNESASVGAAEKGEGK